VAPNCAPEGKKGGLEWWGFVVGSNFWRCFFFGWEKVEVVTTTKGGKIKERKRLMEKGGGGLFFFKRGGATLVGGGGIYGKKNPNRKTRIPPFEKCRGGKKSVCMGGVPRRGAQSRKEGGGGLGVPLGAPKSLDHPGKNGPWDLGPNGYRGGKGLFWLWGVLNSTCLGKLKKKRKSIKIKKRP